MSQFKNGGTAGSTFTDGTETEETVTKLHRLGYSAERIQKMTGLTRAQVKKIIARLPRKKAKS